MKNKILISLALTVSLGALFYFYILSVKHMTITYDEEAHYKYGMSIASGNSNRLDNSKMPFSAFSAVPRVISKLTKDGKLKDFLNDFQTARYVTALFSVLLAIYVYKWSRSLYGTAAAFFSLFLYAFEPNMIAHSQLVTTDLYAALMTTLSLYYFLALY